MSFALALIMFACCNKLSCRKLLYLLGFFLFFTAIGTFAALIILTYTSPIFYSGCKYFKESITDPNKFISNSSFYLANSNKIGISTNVATQYSVCLDGQSGDILSQLSGQQNKNYLDSLRYVMNNITSLNIADLSNKISSSYSPLSASVPNYANSKTLDINDAASIQ